jgi:hypothetical protein
VKTGRRKKIRLLFHHLRLVAGDGNAYVPYTYGEETTTVYAFPEYAAHSVTHPRLLRFSPDGTYSKINLGDWTWDVNCTPGLPPGVDTSSAWGGEHCTDSGSGPSVGSVITNAGTGAAVFATVSGPCADEYTWNDNVDGYQVQSTGCPSSHTQLTLVSNDAITSQVNTGVNWGTDISHNDFYNPGVSRFFPALQREDGSYIGTNGYNNLIALGLDGSVVWRQDITSASVITPLYVIADGGVIVTSTWQECSQTVVGRPCYPSCSALSTPSIRTAT